MRIKVPTQTCIPYGVYGVSLFFSPKHNRTLPIILRVPGFDYIEIHPGNTPKDTDGCFLLGISKGANFIGSSKLAFDAFFPKVQTAIESGEKVLISIEKEVPTIPA